jgi:hypothetical protein
LICDDSNAATAEISSLVKSLSKSFIYHEDNLISKFVGWKPFNGK